MASRKRPASRGFVNNIILESLLSGDKYGYEIIKEVEDKSNGKIILKQPSLYSSLKRFEVKGYITSYWGDSDIGGRRHYYTITEPGKNYYNRTVNRKLDKLDSQLDDEEDDDIDQISIDEELTDNDKPTTEDTKEVTTDTNSDDYNIFELLEKSDSKSDNKLENDSKLEKTQNKEPIKEKETGIQVDMFTQTGPQNEVNKEEKVNVENIQQLKINDTTLSEETKTEDKKEIPLIKEQTQEFFSWEDLKRKQVAQKHQDEPKKEEPLKNQVVIDEYGIVKITDSDSQKQKEHKIYDNVGSRIEYKDPVIKKVEKVKEKELTEEERHIINQKFNEKMDRLIDQKADQKRQSEPVKVQEKPDIDYKNILGELLAKEDDSPISQEDNIVDNDDASSNYSYQHDIPEEKITEAINNVDNYMTEQNPNTQPIKDDFGFKFKPYMTDVDEKKENNFILSNKIKMKYGIFMFVLMILQISTLFIILKSKNLLYTTDYVLYGLSYGLALAILLICIIPFFILPDKRKANNFRLVYSLMFSILLFLSTCALTYAINTFAGLNNSNLALFSSRLLLPMILSINFIITPLLYTLLLYDKSNY